ncbi:hypothetical protein KI387_035663, partial [Taxus chinensis]
MGRKLAENPKGDPFRVVRKNKAGTTRTKVRAGREPAEKVKRQQKRDEEAQIDRCGRMWL